MLEREERILSLIKSNPQGMTCREICRRVPRTIGRKKEKVLPIIEKLHQQGKIMPLKIGKKKVWKIWDFDSAITTFLQETYLEQPDFICLSKWMSWKCKFIKEITRFADEATLHIFCHDSKWYSEWIDKLQDTLKSIPAETMLDPSPMDADHPLWNEACDNSEFIKDMEIKHMKNISTKTKKVAEYCFDNQVSWENIWEKESLEKLKAELDKTPLPPKGKRHE